MDLKTQFDALLQAQRNEAYPLLQDRKNRLLALKNALQKNPYPLVEAINLDFTHRSAEESLFLEIFPAIQAVKYCLAHLKSWMKKRKRHVAWTLQPASAYIMPQPLGVVGIMVPWNYPIYLALVPALYALAAGNRVMIKMSELSAHTGLALQGFIERAGLSKHIVVVNGDVEVAKVFSTLPFGHLLFTGSTQVGRMVMKAASANLTPITLELGGKSPAILSKTMNKSYFNRLFMGKFFNAAQTCVAPDYLLVPTGWEEQIEQEFSVFLRDYYPNLLGNDNYTSIISPEHKQRLMDLLADAKAKGARVVEPGDFESPLSKMPMYLLFDVTDDMLVMQSEIFGPLLPVLTYSNFAEAISRVNQAANPLALYYFGEDKAEINQLCTQTLSGALTINDTIMHVAIDDLPFGGVGSSGMGQYHGQEGFDTFSKLKAVMVQKRLSPMTWLYPPYGKLLRLVLSKVGGIKLK